MIDFKALGEKIASERVRPCYLIYGSRAFAGDPTNPDPDLVQLVWDYVDTLPDNAKVISGGAPGPDSWAIEAANHFNLQTDVYLAQWRRPDGSYNRAAGFERNQRMVNHLSAWAGSKHATAFWDGISSGTAHTTGLLTKYTCEPLIIYPR